MAVSSHRLNMLVAFFFPIATLTAVFGANLSHPLERYLPPPYAFFAVLAAGLLFGCVLAGYLLSTSRTQSSDKTARAMR
jgi:purine-cytosine permease-like protein